ncbi:MAG: phenylalanine--tRNA ligase subunit beta [Aeromonadales bacterium]|nr:phenylalanine--tRNA ligase subunit beta [Aeromonadales bacterium]
MIFNKQWIDELVENNLDAQQLSDMITMAGLEVDSISPVADDFDHIVVGKVLECVPHPDSDHMHVTKVDVGNGQVFQIVCGAPNCREGLKVCASLIGAHVNGITIKKAKLRGVESNGMLCSYKELGMSDESNGIVELPEDAPLGMDIREYFKLNDKVIDVDLTSNRPDCLGICGIAREVSVLLGKEFKYPKVEAVAPAIEDIFPVEVEDKDACPRYLDRVIRGVNQKAQSPLWMVEKLRRCGIRSVSPIVDVTNYVMLEYSQPLHSFDLNKLNDKIIVRKAKAKEPLVVLSGETVELKDNTLVIADAKGPVAIAGIFGGLNSGIDENTTDVLLESAFFSPDAIKGRARSYGLDTDASHRYERGVDHDNQRRAMERATALLIEIAGGKAGPINEVVSEDHLPKHEKITLRLNKLTKVLGKEIDENTVYNILKNLELNPTKIDGGFEAVCPNFRFDIAIEEDLIEEVARIYGYDNIPNATPVSDLYMVHEKEEVVLDRDIKNALVSVGYNEAITYSFTDPKVLAEFSDIKPLMLNTPISPELSAMRTTLLAGLSIVAKYNANRQQRKVRLFEQGLRYIIDEKAENGVAQVAMVAGISVGDIEDEAWTQKSRAVDFFDVKGDVEALLNVTVNKDEFSFVRTTEKFLHPGQGADIYKNGQKVGYFGMLHPLTQKALGFKQKVGVFEILRSAVEQRIVPNYHPISKFPSVRRDFAFVLDKSLPVSDLTAFIKETGGKIVQEVKIFDVFEDESLGDKHSVALGVIAQDVEHTLEEAEVEKLATAIVEGAKEKFGATLRS